MYPREFGTVDQFLVKALRKIHGLPEAAALGAMKPDSLWPSDGVVLIGILRRLGFVSELSPHRMRS